ncbi:MAG TPA: nucleotidyltransferase family protein [Burkholderiaceae bacterium]|nr:nucleotidyltransferase family protein [Burkholderiaceae bacterium]
MTGALILAAGSSSRLGQPKQFVVREGQTLVRRIARVALEAGCAPVVIVEGAVRLGEALEGLPVEIAHCPRWQAGQGASLKHGLAALGDRCDAVVVLLVDQLRVDAGDVRALLAAPGLVAAAAYDGVLGVPARFSGPALAVLRGLPDAPGARAWLARHRDRVSAVPMPHAAVDLDVPGDLSR